MIMMEFKFFVPSCMILVLGERPWGFKWNQSLAGMQSDLLAGGIMIVSCQNLTQNEGFNLLISNISSWTVPTNHDIEQLTVLAGFSLTGCALLMMEDDRPRWALPHWTFGNTVLRQTLHFCPRVRRGLAIGLPVQSAPGNDVEVKFLGTN